MAPFTLPTAKFSPLLDILTEEQTKTQSFETLCNKFHHSFKKEDKFKVANALFCLLQHHEDFLTSQTQKLCAVVLLHDLYRRDPIDTTPYLPLFVFLINRVESSEKKDDALNGGIQSEEHKSPHQAVTDDSENLLLDMPPPALRNVPHFSDQEKDFLSQLVKAGGNTKELLKTSAQRVINGSSKYVRQDISDLQKAMESRKQELHMWHHGDITVSTLVPDPPQNTPVASESAPSSGRPCYSQEEMKKLFDELCSIGLQPSYVPKFLRLAPPVFPNENEACWFHLTDPWEHRILYDERMDDLDKPTSVLQAEHLMTAAVKAALTPEQHKYFISLLNEDPSLIQHLSITPHKFTALTEKNPKTAFELLLKLIHSDNATDYFSTLITNKASLQSMEVVNSLTMKVDLPKEFVHMYIANCINTCQTIQDRYLQSRLVRLACIFFQALIRNKIIDVMDVFSELQQFCISFIRIKEAAALFKMLKSSEGGSNTESAETAVSSASVSTVTESVVNSGGNSPQNSGPIGSASPSPVTISGNAAAATKKKDTPKK